MYDKQDINSLAERWEADVESYKNGAKPVISVPQCETCSNYIKGNALYCRFYKEERKPKYVLFPKKECQFYENASPIRFTAESDIEKKIYGGLFGFCVGDALGVPVEFSTREERETEPVKEMRAYGTYHQPFGTWSDDTSLTICLVDAINKGYSPQRLADNFINFYEKGDSTPYGEVFDIGNSTREAIARLQMGNNPTECGGMLSEDNGNGSLMRILPVVFYGKSLRDEKLIEIVEEISSLTHRHKRSVFACIFYVEFAIQILSGYEKEAALDRTIVFVDKNCRAPYHEEIQHFERILNKEIIKMPKNAIKSTGYVVDTLEAVLWIFFHATGYREAILNAINLGGDTDTIAAITGGIAGIYYGLGDIPETWVQCIAKKEDLWQLFQQFCSICLKR